MQLRGLVVLGFILSLGAQAAEQTPVTVGAMKPVTITEIKSIKLLSSSIDPQHAQLSKAEVEIEGVYEANGAYGSLVGQIVPLSGYAGSEAWPRLELKLSSVDLTKAIPAEGGFITSVSIQKPFVVRVTLQPSLWMSGANLYYEGKQRTKLWTVVIKSPQYRPVQHDKQYYFTASLHYTDAKKEWKLDAGGFEKPKPSLTE